MAIRFYAACLASYNNGVLHGRWIPASTDIAAMSEEIATMLRQSRFPFAEEHAIHDIEGLPRTIGEYSSLEDIAAFMRLVEEFEHIDSDDLRLIVQDFGSVSEAQEALREGFRGVYECFRDYADQCADELLEHSSVKADDIVARYFDYASFAYDLKLESRTIEVSAGIAIFD
jgi:antirestriction protein